MWHSLLTNDKGERAARQFLGLIDEPLLWIRVLGNAEQINAAEREAVVEDAVQMFLEHYRVKARIAKRVGRDTRLSVYAAELVAFLVSDRAVAIQGVD